MSTQPTFYAPFSFTRFFNTHCKFTIPINLHSLFRVKFL